MQSGYLASLLTEFLQSNRPSDPQSELLQVEVVLHILVDGLANHLCPFLTILLLPLGVPLLFSLGMFLLELIRNLDQSLQGLSLTCLRGFRSFESRASSWNPFHFSKASSARRWSSSLSQFNMRGE